MLHITHIIWDTNLKTIQQNQLPTSVAISKTDINPDMYDKNPELPYNQNTELMEEINDYLSDTYGFSAKLFSIEEPPIKDFVITVTCTMKCTIQSKSEEFAKQKALEAFQKKEPIIIIE